MDCIYEFFILFCNYSKFFIALDISCTNLWFTYSHTIIFRREAAEIIFFLSKLAVAHYFKSLTHNAVKDEIVMSDKWEVMDEIQLG